MLSLTDTKNGIPPTIYRTPLEIRRDMADISCRINDARDMLNIRSLLIDILSSDAYDKPERIIEELECAIEEAREALDTLRELDEELSDLEEELGDVRWKIGR